MRKWKVLPMLAVLAFMPLPAKANLEAGSNIPIIVIEARDYCHGELIEKGYPRIDPDHMNALHVCLESTFEGNEPAAVEENEIALDTPLTESEADHACDKWVDRVYDLTATTFVLPPLKRQTIQLDWAACYLKEEHAQ